MALNLGGLGATLGLGIPGALMTKSGSNFLLGKKPKISQMNNFDPLQQAIHQQQGSALQGGGGYGNLVQMLQEMLDPSSDYYKDFENAQMRQFNEETIPNIAERFAGAGALSSSGFGQALGAGASQLQSNLGLMRQSGVQNALKQLLGEYSGYQGQTAFDRYEKPGSEGLLSSLLPLLVKGYFGG